MGNSNDAKSRGDLIQDIKRINKISNIKTHPWWKKFDWNELFSLEMKSPYSPKIKIKDEETIREMSTFVAKGSSYQADHNSHDDLMMNLVMFGWFTSTPFFAESTDVNMKHMLYEQKVKQMEDEVIPVGHMPQQQDSDHPFGVGWETYKF